MKKKGYNKEKKNESKKERDKTRYFFFSIYINWRRVKKRIEKKSGVVFFSFKGSFLIVVQQFEKFQKGSVFPFFYINTFPRSFLTLRYEFMMVQDNP